MRAWAAADRLLIEVADTGIGFTASAGSGVGLANARERLALLYGADAELDLTLNDAISAHNPHGTGVIARVSIPLAQSHSTTPPPAAHADRPAA